MFCYIFRPYQKETSANNRWHRWCCWFWVPQAFVCAYVCVCFENHLCNIETDELIDFAFVEEGEEGFAAFQLENQFDRMWQWSPSDTVSCVSNRLKKAPTRGFLILWVSLELWPKSLLFHSLDLLIFSPQTNEPKLCTMKATQKGRLLDAESQSENLLLKYSHRKAFRTYFVSMLLSFRFRSSLCFFFHE